MWACKNGYKDVVKRLLYHSNSNIDLDARGGYERRNALMSAWREGHKGIVKILLEHSNPRFDLNAKDIYGLTALAIASRRDYLDYKEVEAPIAQQFEVGNFGKCIT